MESKDDVTDLHVDDHVADHEVDVEQDQQVALDQNLAEKGRDLDPNLAEKSRVLDRSLAGKGRVPDPSLAEKSRAPDPRHAEKGRAPDPRLAEKSRVPDHRDEARRERVEAEAKKDDHMIIKEKPPEMKSINLAHKIGNLVKIYNFFCKYVSVFVGVT